MLNYFRRIDLGTRDAWENGYMRSIALSMNSFSNVSSAILQLAPGCIVDGHASTLRGDLFAIMILIT